MLGDDEREAAASYYSKIMTIDDVLQVKALFDRVGKAPADARAYLRRHCRDVRGLEAFFRDHPHLFFVENGRVALNDEEEDGLEAQREAAVDYFRTRLQEQYDGPVHFMKLKEQLDTAPDHVASFVIRFYPGKEFKHFLKSRPDVFIVYKDHTVFLIELESVAFYERELETCPEDSLPLPFLNFRGHIGQAEPHIQAYINKHYPGDEFQHFLRRHPDVFRLDQDLRVSLVPFEEE